MSLTSGEKKQKFNQEKQKFNNLVFASTYTSSSFWIIYTDEVEKV